MQQVVVLSSEDEHARYQRNQNQKRSGSVGNINVDSPIHVIEEIPSDDDDLILLEKNDLFVFESSSSKKSSSNNSSRKSSPSSSRNLLISAVTENVVDVEEILDESSDLEYLDDVDHHKKNKINSFFADNNNNNDISIIGCNPITKNRLRRTFSDIVHSDTSFDVEIVETTTPRRGSVDPVTNKRLKTNNSKLFNNGGQKDVPSSKKEKNYYFDKLLASSLTSSSPGKHLKRAHSIATTTPTKQNKPTPITKATRSIFHFNSPQIFLNLDHSSYNDHVSSPNIQFKPASPPLQPTASNKQKNSVFNDNFGFSSSSTSDPIDDSDNSFDFTLNANYGGNKNLNSITMNDKDYKNYIFSQFTKRELNKVNKNKLTKAEKLTEMNINMDSDFSKLFGLTMDLLNASLDPSNLRMMNLDDAVNEDFLNRSNIRSLLLPGVDVEMGRQIPIGKSAIHHPTEITKKRFANVDFITWTRKCEKIYNKKLRCFLPIKTPIYLLEEKLGIYYQAEKFFQDYKSGAFLTLIQCLKENYPFKQFILFLKDYQQFLTKIKRKESREYADQVRSTMGASEGSRRRTASADNIGLSSAEVENVLIDIQMNHGVYNFVVNVTAELFSWMKSITYTIANCQYKNANHHYDEDDCGTNNYSSINERNIGKVKSGNDAFESYQLSLEQIKYVTKSSAERISNKYSSMIMLYDASNKKSSLGRDSEGNALVNSRIDSTILKLFQSENPDELIYE